MRPGLLRLVALAPLQLLVGLAPPMSLAALTGLPGLLAMPLGLLWAVAAVFLMATRSRAGLLLVRAANALAILCGVALCLLGVYWIRAAEESARHGGGIMGGLGAIPVALGVLVGAAAVVSLALTLGWKTGAGREGER